MTPAPLTTPAVYPARRRPEHARKKLPPSGAPNMPDGFDDDLALEDPPIALATPCGHQAARLASVLVVVEPAPALSRAVSGTCAFLRIPMASVADPLAIGAALAGASLMAILHETSAVDHRLYDLLMVAAGIDPALPLMLILPADPASHAAAEAAQRLWGLRDVTLRDQRPGVRALIDFLFRAGRRLGHGRFLPV
jgi:hypothetical protein